MNQRLQNPFVGLRPFESEDSLYYFGRGEHVKALLAQLQAHRFIAVVGSSGSGKSSLVRAGLVPHLEAGFLVQDRDVWRIAKMKPGDAPLVNLVQALLSAFDQPTTAEAIADFTQRLRAKGVAAISEWVQPRLGADANLFLLVDQFEEIFRFGLTKEQREAAADFASVMLRLVEQAELPVFVCLTMRSDFLGDCDAFHGLPEAMNQSQFLVPRLTRQQRREAIASPIHLSGAAISNRLLDRLLNENVDTRDDLPVLQHAMMRTWVEWARTSNGAIDISPYEKIGTIHSALSQHANEALAELTEAQQAIAKILFQTITETDAGNRRIRRPCHLSEIAAISGAAPEALMEIIQKFREDGRSFLVLSSENPADDPLVDISHESLIRQWDTLTAWVDEEAESAKIYRRLAESAELYQKGKAGLYREADLQVALEWREKQKPNARWAQRYHHGFEATMTFLQKSLALRRKQRSQQLIAVAAIILAVAVAGIWLMWGKDVYEAANLKAPLQQMQQGRMTVADFDQQMDNAKESIGDLRRLEEIKQAFLAVLLDSMEVAACKELNRPRAESYQQTLLKNLPMGDALRRQRLQKISEDYDRRVKQPNIGLTPAIYDTVKTWLDLSYIAFNRDPQIEALLADLANRQSFLDSLQVKIPQDKRFLIGNVPPKNVRLKIILKNTSNLQAATVLMDEAKMPFENFDGQPHRTAFKTFSSDSIFADSTRILIRLHAVTADGIEVTRPETFGLKKLRSRGVSESLSFGAVTRMLIEFDFCDKLYNLEGAGFSGHFAVGKDRFVQKGKVIIDRATGLMWQQTGSDTTMRFEKAADYIAQLNAGRGFAGYRDWRLPTIEEAMSLMAPQKSSDGLYINAVFAAEQRWIWTADRFVSEELEIRSAWVASFDDGLCYPYASDDCHVRAVRAGQSIL